MKLTFLGTGTSQGVPVIGCRCPVCLSTDPRDNRLRTSALIETGRTRLAIDAGPHFPCQMLRAGVRHLDAILLTHEHKDHIGGIDDVRAFNFVDYPPTIRRIDIYATALTAARVRRDFDYAFATEKYRGVPEIMLHEIGPLSGSHSDRFRVTGYRMGGLAYLTDFKRIEPQEEEKLRELDVLVINALRFKEPDPHFNVHEALALIGRLRPREAYLTHMSHEIGLHARTEPTLPPHVHMAYDGLEITINESHNA